MMRMSGNSGPGIEVEAEAEVSQRFLVVLEVHTHLLTYLPGLPEYLGTYPAQADCY